MPGSGKILKFLGLLFRKKTKILYICPLKENEFKSHEVCSPRDTTIIRNDRIETLTYEKGIRKGDKMEMIGKQFCN